MRANYLIGGYIMSQEVLLTVWYEEIFEPLRLRSRADNTRRLYRTTLRNFERFLGRAPLVADLNDLTVSRYLAWFRSLGRAPSTVNKEHANLTAIWRFAYRRDALKEWPNVEREVEPEREPQAWLDYEIQQLYEACDNEMGLIGEIPAKDFWRALILVIWDSGERIGAVIGLTWANVDLVGGWVRVPAEVRKGKRRDRLYRISPETVDTLRRIKRKPGAVFPWPYSKTYLWRRFGDVLSNAGLPNDGRSKFHRIRRTVASYYEAAGGNATELLGHTSRKTTLAYIDRRIVQVTAPKDKLFRLAQ